MAKAAKTLLEEDLREPYERWKANPTPETAAELLRAVEPTWRSAASALGGDSPVAISRARQIVLSSLPRYNPKQAPLRGFLAQQLRGLHRFSKQETTVLSVPERVALDWNYLNEVTLGLEHELGRSPSDAEIADASGLSLRRIRYLRTYQPAAAEGAMEAPPTVESGFDEDILIQLVYDELSPYHQQIMEHTLGLHGKPILSVTELAAKLKRSPGAISQARAAIQQKLDAMRANLEGL